MRSMASSSPHEFELMGLIPVMTGDFLVGYGTRVGPGYISGLGIRDISRLSKHSIAAICCSMAAAAITVFVIRHLTKDPS